MHDEINVEMCSSYDMCESKVSPRSLADKANFIVLLRNCEGMVDVEVICTRAKT